MILSYRYKETEAKLKDSAEQLVAAEQQLAEEMQTFIAQASTTLSDQYESLRIASQSFGDVPEAKTFYNGLRMFGAVTASINRVGHFAAITDDIPATSISTSYEQVIPGVQSLAKARNVTLTSKLDPKLSIHASLEELSQLLFSTIDNAIKFSNSGGNVSVNATQRGKFVQITVTDDGAGFSAEKLAHLFEPFGRGTSTETFDQQGLGLNLYTNKIIIEKLGGSFAIDNVKPSGANVVITLPIGQAAGLETPLIVQPQQVFASDLQTT